MASLRMRFGGFGKGEDRVDAPPFRVHSLVKLKSGQNHVLTDSLRNSLLAQLWQSLSNIFSSFIHSLINSSLLPSRDIFACLSGCTEAFFKSCPQAVLRQVCGISYAIISGANAHGWNDYEIDA